MSTPLNNPFPGHQRQLDGVRGLAILMVLVLHFYDWGQAENLFEKVLIKLASIGQWGVDLFFILSGFLITGILLDMKGRKHYFKNFFVRRVLRIFPLYYLCAFLIFFIAPLIPFFQSETLDSILSLQWWTWSYLVNILIIIKGEFVPEYLSHFWSLAVEEHFYLFWPFVVASLSAERLRKVCLGMIAFSFGLRMVFVATDVTPLASYTFTFCRLDTFGIGGLLALQIRMAGSKTVALGYLKKYGLYLLLGSVPVHALLQSAENIPHLAPWLEPVKYLVWAASLSGLIAYALMSKEESIWGKAWRHPILVFFGKYSYGLYVIHHLISYYFYKVDMVATFQQWLPNHTAAFLLQGVVGILLSLVLAILTFHLFEKPFLKLKVKFDY